MTSTVETPRLDDRLAEILEGFRADYSVSGEPEDPNEAARDRAISSIRELFEAEAPGVVEHAEQEFDNVPWGDHD